MPKTDEFSKAVDLDTEKLVLGSILSGSPIAPVREILTVFDFSSRAHQLIYGRMLDLDARGVPCDYATVGNELRLHDQIDALRNGEASGLSYLVSLSKDIPSLSNIQAYARILKNKSLERDLYRISKKFGKAVHEGAITDIKQAIDSMAADVQRLQDATHSDTESGGRTIEQVVENYPGGVSAVLDPTLRPQGLLTGLSKLDEMTGGFRGGQLITLAGRTSSGKSSLALNIVEKLAFQETRVGCGYFTFEMPDAALLNRLISSRAHVSNYKIQNSFVNQEERRRMQVALAEIMEAPILMYSDSRYKKINELCSEIRHSVKKSNLKFFVVDHLGYITSGSTKGGDTNKAQQIEYFAQRLKDTAMTLDIPILMLCQLKRPPNQNVGKPPDLEDLRDSAGIEQTSDIVLMIWREWLFRKDRENLKDKAVILIQKQREGPVGNIKVRFKSDLTRFEDLGEGEKYDSEG